MTGARSASLGTRYLSLFGRVAAAVSVLLFFLNKNLVQCYSLIATPPFPLRLCSADSSSSSPSVSYTAYSTLPIELIHACDFAKQLFTRLGVNCSPPIQCYEGAPRSLRPETPLTHISPDEDSSMYEDDDLQDNSSNSLDLILSD